jgi:Protein of unknown function (DUF1566)
MTILQCFQWGHRACKWLSLALAMGVVSGFSPAVQAQTRFSYSSDGTEVTDGKTGLIWRRCSEGQTWSGTTCTGSASSFTHEGALAHAKTQTGWRLPNVKELTSLVDRSRSDPSINVAAFPATPSDWYWTSSPLVGDSSGAWFVYFSYGGVNGNSRYGSSRVRLVR